MHYNVHYLSDDEITHQSLLMMETTRPEVIVIPALTRTGRRIAFIELCETLRAYSQVLGHDPFMILDDAQGLGRIMRSRYHPRADGRFVNLWSYADRVILIGAKVKGPVMGSGAMLLSTAPVSPPLCPMTSRASRSTTAPHRGLRRHWRLRLSPHARAVTET